jgi:hypothetical protein
VLEARGSVNGNFVPAVPRIGTSVARRLNATTAAVLPVTMMSREVVRRSSSPGGSKRS